MSMPTTTPTTPTSSSSISTMMMSKYPESFGRHGTIQICRRGKQNNILLVALNRPERYNAFNDDVYEDLIDVMKFTKRDESICGIVLTGVGKYFSSGADIKDNIDKSTGKNTFEPEMNGRETLHKPAGRFMMEIISYPKILAAAVNGPAVGIGVTLLMHCDIVHCIDTATFWIPFTRLALVPELGSSFTLMNSIGLSKANELLLLGKKINANKAYEYNICSKIITDYDRSNNPFISKYSIANQVCNEIDECLLSLPLGNQSVSYFIQLVKGSRRQQMEQIVRNELIQLDERFDSGQVYQASQILLSSSTKKQKNKQQQRSKL